MPKKKSKSKVGPEEARMRAFKRRTCQALSNHKRRARGAGQWLDYGLDELRRLVSEALRKRSCHYCSRALTANNFGLDHRHPLSRGGRHEYRNLLVCCMECNAAKGPLDDIEFRELMRLLSTWGPEVMVNTLARLKAGARYAKLPPTPEWRLKGCDDGRTGPQVGHDNRGLGGGHPAMDADGQTTDTTEDHEPLSSTCSPPTLPPGCDAWPVVD